uniref:Uncharacterized protein n=1 Tax=Castor canadensis TaxID=51338 RepID=A0A8C0WCC5_CASCN
LPSKQRGYEIASHVSHTHHHLDQHWKPQESEIAGGVHQHKISCHKYHSGYFGEGSMKYCHLKKST